MVLLAILIEVVVLTWVQDQNYISFQPFAGDLGNYNQIFYTTTSGQGFFYFTATRLSGGSGSFWGVHFSPILFFVVPLYAAAPSPVTLLVIKQFALALGAVPLYGIARTYFPKGPTAAAFAALYLLSPLTLATDWNNFDPEVFLPFTLLVAFYFFSRGRFWPFIVAWILALSTIEAAPPLMMAWAVGGIIGTYVAKSTGPYWTASQQRKPLLMAVVVAIVWFAIAYGVLLVEGTRGGGFGSAYAPRFTVLGTTSIPDVLPFALLHPGSAGAAIHYQLGYKVLFLELILLGTGVLCLLGGMRYILPVAGYVAIAFLSNYPTFYAVGPQYAALILPFLFVGSVEGVAFVSDLLQGRDPDSRHRALREQLQQRFRVLVTSIAGTSGNSTSLRRIAGRLLAARAFLERDELGKLDAIIRRAEKAVLLSGATKSSTAGELGGSGTGAPKMLFRSKGHLRSDRMRPARSPRASWTTMSMAVVVICVVGTASVANPLINKQIGPGERVFVRNVPPSASTQALWQSLQLIPSEASVLTTQHIFPQVSDRSDAYCLNPYLNLQTGETIEQAAGELLNESQYVVIDYAIDPDAAVILRSLVNLTGYGLLGSDDGAVVYDRGWSVPPILWSPWTVSWAGGGGAFSSSGGLVSNQYETSLGPSLYHPPGGDIGGRIWQGPGLVYLPRGFYQVTFNLVVVVAQPGPQLLLHATATPARINDSVLVSVGGYVVHQPLLQHSGLPAEILRTAWVNASKPSTGEAIALSFTFGLNQSAYVNFPAIEQSKTMAVFLVSIELTELSGFV